MVRGTRLASAVLLAVSVAGCQSDSAPSAKVENKPTTPPAPQVSKPAGVQTSTAQPSGPLASSVKAVRINCGATAALQDAAGGSWLPDTGFVGGETVDRGPITIQNTDTPRIYRTERFDMSSFSHPLPNGKYTVKLHFAETYDEIMSAGERVFSVNVEGVELKNIDPFKEAGGLNKAVVRTVPVEVKDAKLDITFTAGVQSPEINGIEIIPQ